MADDQDDPARQSAPDLRILGDQITLQPSGYIGSAPARKEGPEEALMKNMARFRSEPFQYVHFADPFVMAPTWGGGLHFHSLPRVYC